ncbi:MAG: hypothetical protein WCO35_00005 [Candidatus Nomurabacteria bacterium]
MEPFPPIFAYIIFGFIWFLEVIFTLFVVTIPVAMIISIFDDILIIFWLWLRMGPEMISKFKGKNGDKKMLKRFLTQCAGELIPVADLFPWNLWFIYKVHKDEVAEYREKRSKLDAEREEIKMNNMEVEEEDDEIRQEINMQKSQEENQTEIQKQDSRQQENSNPWIKSRNKPSKTSEENNIEDNQESNNIQKKKEIKKEDLPAELRLKEQLENPDSLTSNQTDYSKFETYQKQNKEKEDNKRQKEILDRKKSEERIIKVQSGQLKSQEKKADDAENKYGKSAAFVQRLKDRVKDKKTEGDDDLIGFNEK